MKKGKREKRFCSSCLYEGPCTTCPKCVVPTVGPCIVRIDVVAFVRNLGYLDKYKRLLHGGIMPEHIMNYLVNTHRKVTHGLVDAAFKRGI